MNSLRKAFRDSAETIIAAVFIFVALQATTQSREIDGRSMQPTFEHGQRVLVNSFVYTRTSVSLMGHEGYLFHGPQRGDIIIFDPPTDSDQNFVKRVIAVPGDTVDIRNGSVYVNEKLSDYVDAVTSPGNHFNFPVIEVPDDEYFVLGDNRGASDDSRSFGYVHSDDIVGRAWFLYWPLTDFNLFR